jgi:hypothetical protein
MGRDNRAEYGVLAEILVGNGYIEDKGEDGRIILKCILKTVDGKERAGLTWLMIQTGVGLLYMQE